MDMTIGQLVEETGVATRTIRTWIALGILPRPNGVGPAALYTRDHLLRIWAALALRREGLRLEDVRAQLESMTLRQMARFAPRKAAPPAPEKAAPPVVAVPSAQAASSPAPNAEGPPGPHPPPLPHEPPPRRLEREADGDAGVPLASFDEQLPGRRYTLVPLQSGIVLMVDDAVSGFVRRIASEIVDRYRAAPL